MSSPEQPELNFHAYARAIHDRSTRHRDLDPEPRLRMFLAAVYTVPGGFRAAQEVDFPENPITREAFLAAMEEAERRARADMQGQLQQAAERLMEAARALNGPAHPPPEKANCRVIDIDSTRELPGPLGADR